jgi:hypothetical protein
MINILFQLSTDDRRHVLDFVYQRWSALKNSVQRHCKRFCYLRGRGVDVRAVGFVSGLAERHWSVSSASGSFQYAQPEGAPHRVSNLALG